MHSPMNYFLCYRETIITSNIIRVYRYIEYIDMVCTHILIFINFRLKLKCDIM